MLTQQQQLQSRQASLWNLENQIGQSVSALNSKPPIKLPSDTQVPRQEDCKGV